jgi:hypothetical protein
MMLRGEDGEYQKQSVDGGEDTRKNASGHADGVMMDIRSATETMLN